jgi:hypothetical protein
MLDGDQLLSAIAHELQHALEVADAPNVRSDEAIRTFFRKIDSGSCRRGPRCAETEQARRIQEVVYGELRDDSRVRRGHGNATGPFPHRPQISH